MRTPAPSAGGRTAGSTQTLTGALDRRWPGSLGRRRLGDARPRARRTAARLAPRRHPQARLASEMEKTEVEEEMLWGRRLRTGPLLSASVREKRKWVILSIRIYGIRRTSDTGPKLFTDVYNGVSQTCAEL